MKVLAALVTLIALSIPAPVASAAKKPPTLSVATAKNHLTKWARSVFEEDPEIAGFSITGCYAENRQRAVCLASFTSVRFGATWSVCKAYQTAYVTNRSSTIRRSSGRMTCRQYGG